MEYNDSATSSLEYWTTYIGAIVFLTLVSLSLTGARLSNSNKTVPIVVHLLVFASCMGAIALFYNNKTQWAAALSCVNFVVALILYFVNSP
jgi:hypothetical protein